MPQTPNLPVPIPGTSGIQLAQLIEARLDAAYTSHSGPQSPVYLVRSMKWTATSAGEFHFHFDGIDHIPIYHIPPGRREARFLHDRDLDSYVVMGEHGDDILSTFNGGGHTMNVDDGGIRMFPANPRDVARNVLDMGNSSDSVRLPAGTTSQRPFPGGFQIRGNTTEGEIEIGLPNGVWRAIPLVDPGAGTPDITNLLALTDVPDNPRNNDLLQARVSGGTTTTRWVSPAVASQSVPSFFDLPEVPTFQNNQVLITSFDGAGNQTLRYTGLPDLTTLGLRDLVDVPFAVENNQIMQASVAPNPNIPGQTTFLANWVDPVDIMRAVAGSVDLADFANIPDDPDDLQVLSVRVINGVRGYQWLDQAQPGDGASMLGGLQDVPDDAEADEALISTGARGPYQWRIPGRVALRNSTAAAPSITFGNDNVGFYAQGSEIHAASSGTTTMSITAEGIETLTLTATGVETGTLTATGATTTQTLAVTGATTTQTLTADGVALNATTSAPSTADGAIDYRTADGFRFRHGGAWLELADAFTSTNSLTDTAGNQSASIAVDADGNTFSVSTETGLVCSIDSGGSLRLPGTFIGADIFGTELRGNFVRLRSTAVPALSTNGVIGYHTTEGPRFGHGGAWLEPLWANDANGATDGQLLVWNESAGEWRPMDPPTGGGGPTETPTRLESVVGTHEARVIVNAGGSNPIEISTENGTHLSFSQSGIATFSGNVLSAGNMTMDAAVIRPSSSNQSTSAGTIDYRTADGHRFRHGGAWLTPLWENDANGANEGDIFVVRSGRLVAEPIPTGGGGGAPATPISLISGETIRIDPTPTTRSLSAAEYDTINAAIQANRRTIQFTLTRVSGTQIIAVTGDIIIPSIFTGLTRGFGIPGSTATSIQVSGPAAIDARTLSVDLHLSESRTSNNLIDIERTNRAAFPVGDYNLYISIL